jgi:hypothetical protein
VSLVCRLLAKRHTTHSLHPLIQWLPPLPPRKPLIPLLPAFLYRRKVPATIPLYPDWLAPLVAQVLADRVVGQPRSLWN